MVILGHNDGYCQSFLYSILNSQMSGPIVETEHGNKIRLIDFKRYFGVVIHRN